MKRTLRDALITFRRTPLLSALSITTIAFSLFAFGLFGLVEESESRKLFPASHKARDVRDGLLSLARKRGADIRFDTQVTGITSEGDRWVVASTSAAPLEADAVIVATGGLSVPLTGSDGTGLRLLERLGHAMHATSAALTPVVASPAPHAALAGVSLTVDITATSGARSSTARGGFLFTHHGYSGPSVLDVSHVVVRSRLEQDATPAQLSVRWAPLSEDEWSTRLAPHGSWTRVRRPREHRGGLRPQ